MATKGESGDRFADHRRVEMTVVCKRCDTEFTAVMSKNTPRKYCDTCGPIVTLLRKRAARSRNIAKYGTSRPQKGQRPRLVRYAGYDPSERNG